PADACRATILPNDGRGQRPSRPAIPGQHGLALVGQPHRLDRGTGLGEGPGPGAEHRPVQLLGVLLDAAIGGVGGVGPSLGPTLPWAGCRGRPCLSADPSPSFPGPSTIAFVAEVPWSIARMFTARLGSRQRSGPPCR